MVPWTDVANWIGPTPNCTPKGMIQILGVCLHIQQGTEAGSQAWESDPASQVSSHFLAPKSGRAQQLVDVADAAWCQAEGNPYYLSIECEGYSGQTLTPDQVLACARITAKAHQLYGFSMKLAGYPGDQGIAYHALGGDSWGGHPDCPGPPIIAQRAHILAVAQHLLTVTPPTVPYPGHPLTEGMTGLPVQQMQNALIDHGYSVGPAGADGRFGPDTALALGRFQLANPACRSVRNGVPDRICGPNTWRVLGPVA